MEPTGPAFSTTNAAAYLREQGVPETSERSLIRYRLRAAEDPGDKGPDFYRTTDGNVVYFKRDLDRYVADRLSTLAFRGRAQQRQRLRPKAASTV